MSAIAAIWHRNGQPAEREEVERLTTRMKHRGPDGINSWVDGPIAVGHCRLITTPESVAENFPWTDPSGDWVVVADARIDNRKELARELGRSEGEADGALLLEAFRKWGERSPEHLLGDFAFLIWDRRTRRLFCARDPMGVRALYYINDPTTFACATELTALLTLPNFTRRINDDRVADLLALTFEDRESTCYLGIQRLPAAHTMVVSDSAGTQRRYWQLDREKELPRMSDDDYAEGLHSHFTEAVNRRVRSPKPVGSMLSGGLDSSSIVAIARHAADHLFPGRLQTFSALLDTGRPNDDGPFIDAMVRQGGFDAHFVSLKETDPLYGADEALAQIGQFPWAPSFAFAIRLHESARARGVRILLDGIDGDSTISHGVAGLTGLAARGRFLTFFREARAFARGKGKRTSGVIYARGVAPFIPGWARTTWRRIKGTSQPRMDRVVRPEFASVRVTARSKSTVNLSTIRPKTGREEHWIGLSSGLMQSVLETQDVLGSAYGFSVAFPFCDTQLLEYCLALPDNVKLRNGWTRWIMRKAMRDLPSEIRWRRTKGNYISFQAGGVLAAHGSDVDRLVSCLDSPLSKYFDLDRLRLVHERYLRTPSQGDCMTLAQAFGLSRWLAQVK